MDIAERSWLAAARGLEPSDLVLKNGKIIDVFSETVVQGDIAIKDGRIAGIGSYAGKQVVDLAGRYVVPGFIDSHLHLESTMVRPSELVVEAARHGTTTFIVDPHEAANVAGHEGIRYIMEQTEQVPANVYVMVPSCVPSSPGEDNGAVLDAAALERYLDHPRVLGLGEVMDSDAVISGDAEMMKKLALFKDKVIDGHAPFLSSKELAAYAGSGIRTDHECTDHAYAMEELKCGMYILIREGSAARNLETIVSGIVTHGTPTQRFCFCTDDKHIEDIQREGHIGFNVKKAIRLGIDPIKAIRMATLQAAECYGLRHLGAIAPGRQADLVVLDDLAEVAIHSVYFKGEDLGGMKMDSFGKCPEDLTHTVKVKDFSADRLVLPYEGGLFPVIETVPGQILTRLAMEEIPAAEGCFIPDSTYNKAAVVERHKGTGKVGLGVVRGFGITGGAIATSVSHDSHNILVIGDNDEDMAAAVFELIRTQGGLTIVEKGRPVLTLPLPVMGLMSEESHEEVDRKLRAMAAKAVAMGVPEDMEVFVTMSFLALPVIPEVRITTRGIYDAANKEPIQ